MPNLNDLIFPKSGITSDLILGTGIDQDALGITAESLGIDAGAPEEILYPEVTDGSRKPYMIPTITSINLRRNSPNYSWRNSDSWTNYYVYMNNDSSSERSFWHALGTYRQDSLNYNNYDQRGLGEVQYAKNFSVVGDHQYNTHPRDTSYGPFRSRVMFLRNFHPTTAKSVTVWSAHSSRWSSGYDGSGFSVGFPNNTAYSNTTNINWSQQWQYQSSTSNRTQSTSFTIQPQQTVAVVLSNTMYYWTSGNNTYRWYDRNGFYNLDGTFSDNWIQPDLKMTYVASQFNELNTSDYNNYTAHKIWNRTAELFGDR